MGNGHNPFEEPERVDRSHENDARSDEGREQGDEKILERNSNDPLDLEPDDPEWSDIPAPRDATALHGQERQRDPAPEKATTTTNKTDREKLMGEKSIPEKNTGKRAKEQEDETKTHNARADAKS